MFAIRSLELNLKENVVVVVAAVYKISVIISMIGLEGVVESIGFNYCGK